MEQVRPSKESSEGGPPTNCTQKEGAGQDIESRGARVEYRGRDKSRDGKKVNK